jgi:hypothetical protein
VQGLQARWGGTNMFTALSVALASIQSRDQSVETWIVCLTDGASADTDQLFRAQLTGTPANLHLIVVGVNLTHNLENHMRLICGKYEAAVQTKGFFVRAEPNAPGIDRAFEVVKSRIPVSQTFERDGVLSDDECRRYMRDFLPDFVDHADMISQSFWVSFLYRRVKVLDDNQSFNYNETHDTLGSSLMKVMLAEAERLLSENQSRDWTQQNHVQLIYDFTNKREPEFRLICTAPDDLDPDQRSELESLDLPGFFIPTKALLDQRESLDFLLARALEVPMQTHADGSRTLECIDDNGFILTLDFTMKLLNIHERVACGVPCLIEGETGVSKTALTKMYAILRNSSLTEKARALTARNLEEIEQQLQGEGFFLADGPTAMERLRLAITESSEGFTLRVSELLRQQINARPVIFAELPKELSSVSSDSKTSMDQALSLLEFFGSSCPEKTFFEINVDSSLSEGDFLRQFCEVRATAKKLAGSEALVVVFLDGEFTASLCAVDEYYVRFLSRLFSLILAGRD